MSNFDESDFKPIEDSETKFSDHDFVPVAEPTRNEVITQALTKSPGLNNSLSNLRENIMKKSGLTDLSAGMIDSLVAPFLNLSKLDTSYNGRLDPLSEKIDQKYPHDKSPDKGYDFDVYKAMGTEDKPFYTPEGAVQTMGGLLGPGAGAVKLGRAGLNLVKKGIEKVSPTKYADEILKTLGHGSETAEDVSTSLGNDIRNAHDMRKAEATAHLSHPLERAGHELIYEKPNPLITTSIDKNKSILNKVGDLNIGDLYDAFKYKPSFQNAHNLQSELGVMIGDLTKNPHKTIAEGKEIQKLTNIRNTLKNDIQDFLKKRDLNSNETLSPMYQKGIDLYREHVAPYLQSKKLRDIVRGGKETVKDIHSIFDTPSDVINPTTGSREIGHVNKIMQDLPESAKGKILFSKIGGYKNLNNPKDIVKNLMNAKNKGYSKYLDKDLESKLSETLQRVHNKKLLGTAAKYIGLGAIPPILLEELVRRNYK